MRTLDDLGYLILQRYRLYAEEGLAGREVRPPQGGDTPRREQSKEFIRSGRCHECGR
jgi:hypothetical protein